MKKLESIKSNLFSSCEKDEVKNMSNLFGGANEEDPDNAIECPTDYTSCHNQTDCATDECSDLVLTEDNSDTPDESSTS